MTAACGRLFENISQKQMYLTGAIGFTPHHESFTVDDDLPSDRCYSETCASVAMAFFAHNMLAIKPDGRYADLMELELFNTALAGMQLDGKRYFYVNPLAVDASASGIVPGYRHVLPQRPAWHACACCPPDLARLIASLGKYLWSEDENTVYSHLLIGSQAETAHGRITMESSYPWEGKAAYTIHQDSAFTLAIHVPNHAVEPVVRIGDEEMAVPVENGYAYLNRTWNAGDRVTISFDRPVRRMYAHPRVRDAAGKVALARGPLVYCVEGVDHDADLFGLVLPRPAQIRAVPSDAFNGMIALHAEGWKRVATEELYTVNECYESCSIHAIPYFAWGNRGKNDRTVWIREK